MNGNGRRLVDAHADFLQEQLMEAQQNLFFARTVNEVKFLQSKITYLRKQVKEIKKKG